MWRVFPSLRQPTGCFLSCALAVLSGRQPAHWPCPLGVLFKPVGSAHLNCAFDLWIRCIILFFCLPTDPAAKLPYINKPLLFLTVKDVALALVEEENRPGKKEVMSRSKCQRKRLLGLKFPDLGCVWETCAVWGPSVEVCVCVCACHICSHLFVLSGIHSWDLLNKKYNRKSWLRSA